MNFFGFHFCHEEFFAMMSSLPFFGLFWLWFRGKYHRLTGKKPLCEKEYHTCHDHKE